MKPLTLLFCSVIAGLEVHFHLYGYATFQSLVMISILAKWNQDGEL